MKYLDLLYALPLTHLPSYPPKAEINDFFSFGLFSSSTFEEESEKGNLSQRQLFDMMIDFVVSVYENQFTRDDVLDRLHAPDATEELQSQIQFVAQGQMGDERKKELKKMI